jgi:uncharacterized phiE125 gp8 family phage protein
MQQIHALRLVTPPDAGDPVITTAEAKLHLRVDGNDEDALIDALVQASTQTVEAELRRALVTQTWDLLLDCFPACGVVELPYGATAVTSVTYVDDAGGTQTLATSQYVVDVASAPGRLVRADGITWPTTERRPNAVAVRMTCGFGAASAVPESVKAWMKLYVGGLYRNREVFAVGVSVAELPFGFASGLLDPWRLLVV